MNMLTAFFLLTLAGCHDGFCHNEFFLLGTAFAGFPFIGWQIKNVLLNLHKNLGHDVPKCEQKCKEHN
jgi:hypothetical protein